jgi:hypothetical protein
MLDETSFDYVGRCDETAENVLVSAIKTGGYKKFDLSNIVDLYTEIWVGKGINAVEPLLKGCRLNLPFPRCWFEFKSRSGGNTCLVLAWESETEIVFNPYTVSGSSIISYPGAALLFYDDGSFAFADRILVKESEIKFYAERAHDLSYDPCFDAEESTNCSGLVVFAMYLLNWKNDVIINEQQPSRQQKRRAKAEKRKPPQSHIVLNVGRWVKRYRSLSNAGDEGRTVGAHSVRAHSVTYFETNPLFGCKLCKNGGHTDGSKPHVGNFWLPAHFIDDKKTYVLRSPELPQEAQV